MVGFTAWGMVDFHGKIRCAGESVTTDLCLSSRIVLSREEGMMAFRLAIVGIAEQNEFFLLLPLF